MFLSATHFPSPVLTAQAFQGLSLCRLLLYPGQACGSAVTIGKGRSHQLHAGKLCPRCISPCLSSPHFQVPKSVFFSHFSPSSGDPRPSRECFLWGCERWQSFSLLSACCFKGKGWMYYQTVRKPWVGKPWWVCSPLPPLFLVD